MVQQLNDLVSAVEEWTKLLKVFQFQQENNNVLIANYLVREGYKEAVETFIQESNVTPTISICSLEVRVQITELIRKGNTLEAGEVVENLFPDLLAADHLLKFQLVQLHVIELIRMGCTEDALFFAQTLPYEAGKHLLKVTHDIERTMMLLIYDDPLTCPFGALLEQSHREKVAHAFNEAILKRTNEGLPSAELNHLPKMVQWCQNELSKGKIQFIPMKNYATATLELE